MDLEVATLGQWCINSQEYVVRVALTPRGGCGPYTYYHDATLIKTHSQGITYDIKWREEASAVGTLSVIGQDGQRVDKSFFYKGLDCN